MSNSSASKSPVLTTLTRAEFKAFADESPYANFMQSAERGDLREKMGYTVHYLGLKSPDAKPREAEPKETTDKILAAGLLVEKDHEAWLQIGPLLDWDDPEIIRDFLTATESYCKSQRIVELEVYPPVLLSVRSGTEPHLGDTLESFDRTALFDLFKSLGFTHLGFTKKLDFKALRWMFVKDLSGISDPRELELSWGASTRKKYHQTLRNLDIHILTDKSELKSWLEPLKESDAKNHIKTRPLRYFEDLWDAFGDQATFVEARLKDTGEIVSSELDLWTPRESVAFLAGTKTDLKKYNGIVRIKGWQLEECLHRHQTRANFYGVDGIFTPDNPLLKSKSGFHGDVEEYVGGFRKILSPTKFYLGKVKRRLKR